MSIPETYDYLVRARRDLWATLEGVPDEALSRWLLDGSRYDSPGEERFTVDGLLWLVRIHEMPHGTDCGASAHAGHQAAFS